MLGLNRNTDNDDDGALWEVLAEPTATTTTTLKAAVLVGGAQKGTRFRPLSLQLPKPLFPVAGVPLVEHHIEQLSKVYSILFLEFLSKTFSAAFENAGFRGMTLLAVRTCTAQQDHLCL
ncbi:unnamed protein product [Gongylonema pulchrum]|uniref:NTP_transferase domain-containing protein n=1 Tax=Gongylonema pulchrum TaxID=637853 RepID=A0A183EWA9_9BILA|nr:unnamed protein product [Gongylonema pulchrum]